MLLGLGFGRAFQKGWNDGASKDLSAAPDRHLSMARPRLHEVPFREHPPIKGSDPKFSW
jgi:hypothetical protein